MKGVARVRRIIVGCSAAATGLCAGLTALYSPVGAVGVLLGGAAGIIPFWVFGVRVQRLARSNPEELSLTTLRWNLIRSGLSVAALITGYLLDPAHVHGLLGALGGLFVPRLVLIGFTLSGWDLSLARETGSKAEG